MTSLCNGWASALSMASAMNSRADSRAAAIPGVMPPATARPLSRRQAAVLPPSLQREGSLCLPSFRLRHRGTRPTPARRGLQPTLPSWRDCAAAGGDGADASIVGQQQRAGTGAGVESGASGLAAEAALARSALGQSGASGAASSGVVDYDEQDQRWHQEIDRVLMDSLQTPKSSHPSWWGERFAGLQKRFAELLESREAHYFIIGLVLVDLAIVLTELVLSSFYPSKAVTPHIVHVAEEALSWTSIGILTTFAAELVAKLLVFGHQYFTHSKWHMFDAVIVCVSLTLELSLKGVAQEVASLLIFFRLWRIMRIMHGVAEAMELNHNQELHALQHDLAHAKSELAVQRQRADDLQQQVALLNVAAVAKGLDLHTILSTAAAQQAALAATAQQQLLTAAAATASKGLDLQNILSAAAAQQQQVAATAQQQLLAAAAAAAAAPSAVPSAPAHALALAGAGAAHVHADPLAEHLIGSSLSNGSSSAPSAGSQQHAEATSAEGSGVDD